MKKINDILKLLDRCNGKTNPQVLLADIFELGAISISNTYSCYRFDEREKIYNSVIMKYDKDTQRLIVDIFTAIYELLSDQYLHGFDDYLGKLYMMSYSGNAKSGQFFTPYEVSRASAYCVASGNENVIFEKIKNDGIYKIHEPTCGSGGMITALIDILHNDYKLNISRNLLVRCGDLDKRCVYMTYLQLTLAGVPAVIYHKDALSNEKYDDKYETLAYCLQRDRFER